MDTSAYENMRAGKSYGMPNPYLIGLQIDARAKRDAYNATPMREAEQRQAMLKDMLGSFGTGMILSPVVWEYGKHIYFGERVFVNFDCVFLDGADIRVGSNTVIGPRAQFLTAGHPLDPSERIKLDPETGIPVGSHCVNKPITIGRQCWIGAGAIILGGVTIGDGTTIGAGSVVTRDVASGVLAAGNPCRVIREVVTDRVRPSTVG
ncbi:sugar O-acetyltransferase [Devosia sp. LC5]|uniref:sugar O-acetyltransferase n=1 Tax=Devosia sp. LC5 TaxID=1502724 RepID=UPI0005532BC2|nr:sugar O-acetyltransferase [Devosia sp. LC5]